MSNMQVFRAFLLNQRGVYEKNVDFYLNGVLVGQKVDAPSVARIGEGHLGAWASDEAPGLIRPFSGEMDEFVLIARALSAAEVNALYQVGKPAE